jgi:hypothetical protein
MSREPIASKNGRESEPLLPIGQPLPTAFGSPPATFWTGQKGAV